MKDSTLKCLWADDYRNNRDFAVFSPRILEFGWELFSRAGTREESLNNLRERFFDVLIIGGILPNDEESIEKGEVNLCAGLQVLQEIRKPRWEGKSRLGKGRNIEVVVVWTERISFEYIEATWDCLEGRDFLLRKLVNDDLFCEIFEEIDRRLKVIRNNVIRGT